MEYDAGRRLKLNRHLALRAGIEEALVRYRTACLDSPGVGIPYGLHWLHYEKPCQVRGEKWKRLDF